MRSPAFELTAHAAAAIKARGIDPAWIGRVISGPERVERHAIDPTLRHALARIPERSDRVLRVVYNANVNPPRVVTAYFDRRQRGKP
jgi:uncharacterized protein DUF4258